MAASEDSAWQVPLWSRARLEHIGLCYNHNILHVIFYYLRLGYIIVHNISISSYYIMIYPIMLYHWYIIVVLCCII